MFPKTSLLMLAVCVGCFVVVAQEPERPIEKSGLIAALQSEILTANELIEKIETRGVNFRLESPFEGQLRQAAKYLRPKETDRLIDVVRRNFRLRNSVKPAPNISQTITNSPGAIQAVGDITINTEPPARKIPQVVRFFVESCGSPGSSVYAALVCCTNPFCTA